MTGRGRGIRAKKIEKPRPLRSISMPSNAVTSTNITSQHVAPVADCVDEVNELINNFDSFIWKENQVQNVSQLLVKKGDIFEANCPDNMQELFNNFREAIRSNHVSPAIRCTLLELLERRSKKWNKNSDLEYYKKKKRDLENFNVLAPKMKKMTLEEDHDRNSKKHITQTIDISSTRSDAYEARKTSLPSDDVKSTKKRASSDYSSEVAQNWQPMTEDSSAHSNRSSLITHSSDENFEVIQNVNGIVTETSNALRFSRGRGSRRSSRSSEGSIQSSVKRGHDEELPTVGRSTSKASSSTCYEMDDVFQDVADGMNSTSSSVPEKQEKATIRVGSNMITVTSSNKTLVQGVERLVKKFSSALERYLEDGVLNTVPDRRLYGGQGYYTPLRQRERSLSGQAEKWEVKPLEESEPPETSNSRFTNTPVAAKLSEAILDYEEKKKESSFLGSTNAYSRFEMEKVSGSVRDEMGYLIGKNVVRQPIMPLSSPEYVHNVEEDQPGGARSVKGRRANFSKTSHRFWNRIKEDAEAKKEVIRYEKDFLLYCGSAVAAMRPPSCCDWDSIAERNPLVCFRKVNATNIALRIFKFSQWSATEESFDSRAMGFNSRFSNQPRSSFTSSHQRTSSVTTDTSTERPKFQLFSRSKSSEEDSTYKSYYKAFNFGNDNIFKSIPSNPGGQGEFNFAARFGTSEKPTFFSRSSRENSREMSHVPEENPRFGY